MALVIVTTTLIWKAVHRVHIETNWKQHKMTSMALSSTARTAQKEGLHRERNRCRQVLTVHSLNENTELQDEFQQLQITIIDGRKVIA